MQEPWIEQQGVSFIVLASINYDQNTSADTINAISYILPIIIYIKNVIEFDGTWSMEMEGDDANGDV